MTLLYLQNPLNPLSHTTLGKSIAASLDVFERTTRRYGKPAFGITTTQVGGVRVPVREETVWSRPFCNLVHFERGLPPRRYPDPKVLLVAPMSGHYATLLRGTAETMMQRHDVYITDWVDARSVPLSEGNFDLDDYIDYLISMLHFLGPDTHVIGVCQPSVPVLAATALMEERGDEYAPRSMVLMGGPIDTRQHPTAVNQLALEKGTQWFRENVIMRVPFPHPGFMREVYPGFLQLSGFMGMNLDRHLNAHAEYFRHLVRGDGDDVEKHREFYDEYLAVMDLTAEFYLQTVETVFVEHALPKGKMMHRKEKVNPAAIRRAGLLTVEGENDDISGVGQTEAAHRLCSGIPAERKAHYLQPTVGHYGVFNGSRFRAEIAPRIADFIRSIDQQARPATPRRAAPAAVPQPESGGGTKVASVAAARSDAADDLTQISGIGPKMKQALNAAGIFHFSQIAALSAKEIAELEARLTSKGRINREGWVRQAKKLAAG